MGTVDESLLRRLEKAAKQTDDDTSDVSPDTGGGNPPGGGQLEKRVDKLESAMADIQIRLIRVESKLDSTATKADLSELAVSFHKAMNEQTWKFLAGATSMAALFSAIAFGLARAMS